jgi:superfamily II DNA or RNA helicase
LLSATPGDSWSDYIPAFIANGFYKNRTQFNDEHIVYKRFSKFPQIDRFINTGRLIRLRNKILVDMDFNRKTVSHHIDVWCDYPKMKYADVMKNRWNPYKEEPIVNAAELCYTLRKVVNSDMSRLNEVIDIFHKHRRVIIFYNFDYELEILQSLYLLEVVNPDGPDKFEVAEWNGHKHQEIPKTLEWIYLVQYNAGAEGWNCIKTDAIIFYSQNYSYKIEEQARGRIDRLNTPFTDLYYYHLKSKSKIDLAIARALAAKKNFNEGKYVNKI